MLVNILRVTVTFYALSLHFIITTITATSIVFISYSLIIIIITVYFLFSLPPLFTVTGVVTGFVVICIAFSILQNPNKKILKKKRTPPHPNFSLLVLARK